MEVLALEELEEMSTAAGWEVEYRQLEPGMIRTSVTGAELGSASLIREFSNRRVEVNGAPPEEMVVVLAPNGGTRLRVNGQMIRRDEVFVLAPGSELHAASLPDADVVSLHLPVRLLAEALEVNDLDLDSALPRGQSFRMTARTDELTVLRRAMNESFSLGGDAFACAETSAELAARVALVLADPDRCSDSSKEYGALNRRRLLNRACEFIDAHLSEPLRITDICRHAGVSVSTLERLFRRELQTLPKRYILARRLDKVRRLLAQSDGRSMTIAELATRSGFHHLGRFSAEYRHYFGSSPSDER